LLRNHTLDKREQEIANALWKDFMTKMTAVKSIQAIMRQEPASMATPAHYCGDARFRAACIPIGSEIFEC
jgi:hypothetical protein